MTGEQEKDWQWSYWKYQFKDGLVPVVEEQRFFTCEGMKVRKVYYWKPISECVQIGWFNHRGERHPRCVWKYDATPSQKAFAGRFNPSEAA